MKLAIYFLYKKGRDLYPFLYIRYLFDFEIYILEVLKFIN